MVGSRRACQYTLWAAERGLPCRPSLRLYDPDSRAERAARKGDAVNQPDVELWLWYPAATASRQPRVHGPGCAYPGTVHDMLGPTRPRLAVTMEADADR